MNLKKNKKGFTLVELIVVLVIIGILLAMVIPNLTGYIDRARSKNAEANARSAYMAAMTVAAEMYAVKSSATDLDADEMDELADVPGTVTVVYAPASGELTTFEYTEGEYVIKLEDGVLKLQD